MQPTMMNDLNQNSIDDYSTSKTRIQSTAEFSIAKRASDVMTETRLRETNWSGGGF